MAPRNFIFIDLVYRIDSFPVSFPEYNVNMDDLYPNRDQLTAGMSVVVIEKHNQQTGIESTGIIDRILSPGFSHPHGIKVMLIDGRVGRVKRIG